MKARGLPIRVESAHIGGGYPSDKGFLGVQIDFLRTNWIFLGRFGGGGYPPSQERGGGRMSRIYREMGGVCQSRAKKVGFEGSKIGFSGMGFRGQSNRMGLQIRVEPAHNWYPPSGRGQKLGPQNGFLKTGLDFLGGILGGVWTPPSRKGGV